MIVKIQRARLLASGRTLNGLINAGSFPAVRKPLEADETSRTQGYVIIPSANAPASRGHRRIYHHHSAREALQLC